MKVKLAVLFVFMVLGCKAQIYPQGIIPVENFADYQGEIHDGDYIKDVNHLLDKYEGTWVGSYDNNSYKIVIEKVTDQSIRTKADILLLHYKITDENNNVLASTLIQSDHSWKVVNGQFLREDQDGKEYYELFYLGIESDCGQRGNMYVYFSGNDLNTLYLAFQPHGEYRRSDDCPPGVHQVFPILNEGTLKLIKQ